MPFEHHKNALIEAAATGAELQGELRAHLEVCDSCRAAFAEERALFASIDAGLKATANTQVPPSFLPRVRASLDEAGAPGRSWVNNWYVLASAAVVIVAFFAARALLHSNVGHGPVETTVKTSVPPQVTRPPQHQNSAGVPPEKNQIAPRQFAFATNHPDPETSVRKRTEPEVLVPRDQEILLAEYATQWNLRKRGPLVVQDSDTTIMALLQVAPIQIDELGVKLLAEEKQQ
jgi:hypothetical protein